MRRGIILSLEAALAVTVFLSVTIGFTSQLTNNPFYKNTAFVLANDLIQSNGILPEKVGEYLIVSEPDKDNCVQATRTKFENNLFYDEELFVCWNEQ